MRPPLQNRLNQRVIRPALAGRTPWQQRSRRLAPAPPHRGRRAQPVPPRPSPDLLEGLTQQQRDGSSREATPAGHEISIWENRATGSTTYGSAFPNTQFFNLEISPVPAN